MKLPRNLAFRLMGMGIVMGLFLTACSSPRPVLYPNAYLNQVGHDQAEQDISECRQLADEHVPSKSGEKLATNTAIGAGVGAASGAAIGAVSGSAGRGSAIGAVSGATWGFLRGVFNSPKPSRAYQNFVNKCLEKKGYEPTGWE